MDEGFYFNFFFLNTCQTETEVIFCQITEPFLVCRSFFFCPCIWGKCIRQTDLQTPETIKQEMSFKVADC